jgi:hypothetical protein
MLKCITWLALAALACSSDDDTVKESHDFTDAEGRSCQAVLERTSTTSPVVSSSVECDGAGKACSSESTPCFQLSVDAESAQLRNCPACCKGSSSSFVGSECSVVSCQSDADCVFADATCEGGVCNCAQGHCE